MGLNLVPFGSVLTIDTGRAKRWDRRMPRQLRIEYEGAIYHVMNRGDRREEIVRDDGDRESFVATLGAAAQRCEWEVHAWCLMGNHFHLVVETPRGNLVTGMKWFLGTYTMRFNARNRQRGHLFAGRYKSLVIDDREHHYLRVVSDYVHLNPARARLLRTEEALEGWGWSSYPDYLRAASRRPAWLRTDRVLGEHGIERDTVAGRREFARCMELRRLDPQELTAEPVRRGWRLGGEEFVAWLLEKVGADGPKEGGGTREYEEAMAQKAERLVREELARAGWSEAHLVGERKGHAVKVKIARRLRSETTMTLKWIAKRLAMGQWTSVSNLLRAKPTP